MQSSTGLGALLRSAIENVRSELKDPTAEISVITPSAGNGVLARRSLAETGAFVRIIFITPEQLVRGLAATTLADQNLRREPSAWLSATLTNVLAELDGPEA